MLKGCLGYVKQCVAQMQMEYADLLKPKSEYRVVCGKNGPQGFEVAQNGGLAIVKAPGEGTDGPYCATNVFAEKRGTSFTPS